MTIRHALQLLTLAAAFASGPVYGIEYGVLKYADGKAFQTGVFQPRYIGELPAKGKAPYLVFSGRSCNQCDANRTIYIHSPDDGPMLGRERDRRYTYPGEYRDDESQQLVHTARVFIGQCLASSNSAVLWFQKERTESGKWKSGVFVAEVVDDRLVARSWADSPPKLAKVIEAVKKGSCRELKGVKGSVEP
jgi:hypothetical protein